MVALSAVLSDVVQNVVFLATPPLLWLFLYLFAWEDAPTANAAGFSRRTFWLLLPGSLVGTLANLPFVTIGPAIVAINIGGGVIPLLLTGLLAARLLGGTAGSAVRFGLLFVVESLAALLWVVLVAALPSLPGGAGALDLWLDAGVVVLAAAVPAAWAAAERTAGRSLLGPGLLGLASVALVATFATTEAIPGVGIVSSFPGYLLAPMAVGVLAVVAIRWGGARPDAWGLTAGYVAATLGVVVGADVLRQPPLYANPQSAIYSVGGAGLLDLVYLSGLLALAAGFLAARAAQALGAGRPGPTTVGIGPASGAPTAPGGLRRSLQAILDGDLRRSISDAGSAARDARDTARRLAKLPPPGPTSDGWADLGAPPWVGADQRNLDALATQPGVTARDAWRAHLTGRYLVRLGRALGRDRLAGVTRRSAAFAIDLAVALVPAVALWAYLARTLPGSSEDVLAGAPYNAAAFAFATYAFVYVVVSELVWGTTLGKRAMGLRVEARTPGRPGVVPIVVRNSPKLIPLSLLGFGGAATTLLLLRGSGLTQSLSTASGIAVPVDLLAVASIVAIVGFGLAICGAVSAIAIWTSHENQRLGDYFAGTWVTRR